MQLLQVCCNTPIGYQTNLKQQVNKNKRMCMFTLQYFAFVKLVRFNNTGKKRDLFDTKKRQVTFSYFWAKVEIVNAHLQDKINHCKVDTFLEPKTRFHKVSYPWYHDYHINTQLQTFHQQCDKHYIMHFNILLKHHNICNVILEASVAV